jgi:predicted transcriptional regulator
MLTYAPHLRHVTDRTTVRLPEELKRRAMRVAADKGRTLTSLIEEGLRSDIAERSAPSASGRACQAATDAREAPTI